MSWWGGEGTWLRWHVDKAECYDSQDVQSGAVMNLLHDDQNGLGGAFVQLYNYLL